MKIAGPDFWLFTDDAIAHDFVNLTAGIGDDPAACQQAHRNPAAVMNRYRITEDETPPLRIRLISQKTRFHVNFYAFRGHSPTFFASERQW